MRIAAAICSFVSWVFTVIALFVSGLLILTFWMPPFFSAQFPGGAVPNAVNQTALPFVVAGTVLFAAGFFLFRFVRRWRWWWYAALAVGAVILAGVGLYLKVMYPETILSNEQVAGYNSAFKLVWRHFLPVFVAVFQLLAGLFRSIAEDRALRREAIREIESRGVEPKYE